MNVPVLFAVCVLIWGTTWYAITFQLAGTTPEVGTALRFSLGAIVLIAWCVWRRVALHFPWPVHVWLVLLGLLNFSATYVLVYFAELYIVSGLVAVGYSAMPLVNMAMARMFFGTPLSRRISLGGVCGVAGIALIFWPEFERLSTSEPLLIGAVLTAAAVLFSGLGNMIVARNHRIGVGGSAALALAMAYGALATWILVIARGDVMVITWTPAFVASLIYLAIFGSVLAFGAYFALLAVIGPARSAYVGVMSTVVALFVSSIFEAYDWGWATVCGIALAILGNVLALNVKAEGSSPSPPTKSVA